MGLVSLCAFELFFEKVQVVLILFLAVKFEWVSRKRRSGFWGIQGLSWWILSQGRAILLLAFVLIFSSQANNLEPDKSGADELM